MKVKTSELIGPALDWAVAESEGNVRLQYDSREGMIVSNVLGWVPYRPSVAWVQGGPIIEREKIATDWNHDCWNAAKSGLGWYISGPTPLIAAMRCHIYAELGDEVEVPEELCTS